MTRYHPGWDNCLTGNGYGSLEMVKILRHTTDHVDGISLAHYLPGRVYDVPPLLADYLVMQGYAIFEMRRRQRSHRARPHERRRSCGVAYPGDAPLR